MSRLHNHTKRASLQALLTFALLACWISTTSNAEADTAATKAGLDSRTLRIKADHSLVVDLPVPIKRISTGNAMIADVVVISPTQLYISARTIGSSNVTAWDRANRLVCIYKIQVTRDLDVLKERLHQLFPDEPIEVREMEGGIVMSGTVSSLEVKKKAEDLGLAFSVRKIDHTFTVTDSEGKASTTTVQTKPDATSGSVERRSVKADKDFGLESVFDNKDYPWFTSLLSVGDSKQIMLEVRFAEVNRNVLKRFNVNLGFMDNAGNFGFTFLKGLVSPVSAGTVISPDTFATELSFSPNMNAMGGYNFGSGKILGFVDILKENGVARILAEPNLLATSGEKAEFVAGGQFPVPIPSRDGISVTFKTFGVQIRFRPEIMTNGKIKLEVEPEVSDLDFNTAVVIQNYVVPGVTTRKASTKLELNDGQSFAIAGLLKDDLSQNVSKIPLLGDIPILGSLFRSTNYTSKKTDLMIVVTPRIVRDSQLYAGHTVPGDGVKVPGDWDFYLMGGLTQIPEFQRPGSESSRQRDPASSSPTVPVSSREMEGHFGHEWID